MDSAVKFIEKHIPDRKILNHCNLGVSRSPSIALLYLAHIGIIKNDTFENAMNEFKQLFPAYNPGKGILAYLNKNWKTVLYIIKTNESYFCNSL